MNANLAAYYWAEQTNRQRLSEQAARGWQVEQATQSRPATNAARLRRAAGTLLVRAGTRLQGIPMPGPVLPLATDGGTPS
jgi:hypothetical protein